MYATIDPANSSGLRDECAPGVWTEGVHERTPQRWAAVLPDARAFSPTEKFSLARVFNFPNICEARHSLKDPCGERRLPPYLTTLRSRRLRVTRGGFRWNAGECFPGITEPECRFVWGFLPFWRKCRLRMWPVLESAALCGQGELVQMTANDAPESRQLALHKGRDLALSEPCRQQIALPARRGF